MTTKHCLNCAYKDEAPHRGPCLTCGKHNGYVNWQPMGFADSGADIEARMEHDALHLNCPTCGGSGHVDDMGDAARVYERQVAQDMDLIADYRNGNTALLETLMLTVWEQPGAEAAVRQVLTEAGMLVGDQPQWEALALRKNARWSWREAVRRLVTDEAEQLRLLAMDDKATRIDVAAEARLLVAVATQQGQVLTVEQVPLQPLAMGHYTTTVTVREAR